VYGVTVELYVALLILGHPATSTIIVMVDGGADVVVGVGAFVLLEPPELLFP
jgi:hypothetical protein